LIFELIFMLDLIIIGSSASGMSAAVYAARAELDFLIVAKDQGGETAEAGLVENYLGFSSISGMDLANKFKDHLQNYQPKIIFEEVVSLSRKGETFLVKTAKQELEAKTVIIASGSVAKRIDAKGEQEFLNKGISYCETCDGPMFKNKNVAVVGGGNSAIKAALALSEICKKVSILTMESQLAGEKLMVDKIKAQKNIAIIYQTKTLEFLGAKMLESVKYQDLKIGKENILPIDGAFIYVGFKPNTLFIDKNLDILNSKEEVVIDKIGKTKIPGLFAAGNVVDFPYKQISIAVGSGTLACLSAINYLKQKSL